ncbi:MAG: translocation/assembly module TamB [Treponema sp.]|nr:translocation/assembly module TamB [Treponema sp.]
MSIFIVKDGKKVIPVTIYVKFFLFLALIALSSVLLRPIQNALSREMINVRTTLIQNLEDLTGMQVRYSSLRPSFLGLLEIKNLRLTKDDTPFFTVSGIKIHFSLFEFIFRKKTFIHTVQIDYPSLFLDSHKDSNLLEYIRSVIDDRKNNSEKVSVQQIMEFLPRQASYQIRHLNINYTDRFSEYKIENMNVNLREDDGEISLYGRFLAEFKINNVSDKTIIVSADAGINGTYFSSLEEGSAELSVYYLTGLQQEQIRKNVSFFKTSSSPRKNQKMLFSMNPFNMGVTYKDFIVNFIKTEEDNSSNINLNYSMETGAIDANIVLDNFRPGSLISISDLMDNADSILQLKINGNAAFESENGKMKYSADINGEDVIVINAYGNEKKAVINDFHITSPAKQGEPFFFYGSAGAKGNLAFYPLESEGTIFFKDFSFTQNDTINALFEISSQEGEIFVHSENASIAQTVIEDFSLFLYPLNKNVGITVSSFFNNGGAVYLDAIFNDSPSEIEAAISIDSLSLFEIAEITRPFSNILDLPAISRASLKYSSLNADVFFSTDFNNIVYNAPNIAFNFRDVNAQLSISGSDKQLTLTEGIFVNGEEELQLSSKIDFANPMELVFAVNANYRDLSWNIDGQILDRTTLIVRDPNGFHAYGNITNTGAMSGYIEGIDYPVSIKSDIVYLNFFAALRFDSPQFWNMSIDRFTAREANSSDGREFLRISGIADQDGASFKNITYRDSVGMLYGDADFTWTNDFSYWDYVINITDRNEAGEYYFSRGIVQGENIFVQASVSDMHVNRFLGQNRPMLLSANAEATWDSINLFNARISLESLNMKVQDDQLNAAVDLNFTNDELLISDLKFGFADFNASLGELQLNRIDGVLKAGADINGILRNKNLEGNIAINANFTPINSWLAIKDAVQKFDGNICANHLEFGLIKEEDFNITFAGEDGSFSLKAGKNEMVRIELDTEGDLFAGFSAPFPIRGTLIGKFKDWNIDAYCNDLFIDISTLYTFVSTIKDFKINGGYIAGKAGLKGPIWNPEYHGNVRASSMRFQAPNFVPEDIRTVPFDILAQGYEMTFGPVDTVCGLGGGKASGWLQFENWGPSGVGLDIFIPRETPVPYDINITGFLAKGGASGKLLMNVDSANSLIELQGDLFTNEAELGLRIDDIMSNFYGEMFVEVDFNTIVDFKVTTGTMVEFLWPAGNPILRANPEMGSVVYITSDTSTQQYSLISDVKIRSGELNYFDRNFYIRQGNLIFRENETRFDPMLTARAEIRDRSDTGPVIISMIIENQPLFGFEPRFEASPSLTQLEIYSILGQTFNSIQGEEGSEMAQRFLVTSTTDLVTQLIASSDVWSQFAFVRNLERRIRNTLGFDMFSVRTKILQNMVATGASELTYSNNFTSGSDYVGNFFDNTTVFVGKYIGQHMFAQAMLRVRQDENSDFLGGIRLEPDIGIELQSPFFTIRWDLYPYRPEDWKTWLSGNSITLSWSKSF